MKTKIIGAGSVGNHLAQACRRAGWSVDVVDADPKALERMKNDIYPSRYGAWDEAIKLFSTAAPPLPPIGGYDVIFVGTPPDARMKVATEALKESPRVLQLEKPLCPPTEDSGLKDFLSAYNAQNSTVAVVGYDHAVAESVEFVVDMLEKKLIGEIDTIDVETREHWEGIFKAHPWLSGPQDTYLGYWKRGGGAGGEHSHALHLWLYLAKKSGFGDLQKANAFMDIRQDGKAEYDAISIFSILTSKNKIGRVVQDVVTRPTRKWFRLQGKEGFIEWYCNGAPEGDLVKYQIGVEAPKEKIFAKKRPDDFYREVLHIADILSGKIEPKNSPIAIETGVEVMMLLEAAHKFRNNNAIVG